MEQGGERASDDGSPNHSDSDSDDSYDDSHANADIKCLDLTEDILVRSQCNDPDVKGLGV
jgi:hypothetical protein